MTERPEVRFNVYSSTATAYGSSVIIPYDVIDFDTVAGYNAEYKYNIQVAGTYLIGISYQKTSNIGGMYIRLVKNGTSTVTTILYTASYAGIYRTTINGYVIQNFEVGDVIYPQVNYGAPKVNEVAPTGNNIHNSFWGIRLDFGVII